MADFDGPDGKELTDHQDAKKNYDRLVKQKGLYTSNEIILINFLGLYFTPLSQPVLKAMVW